jgi:hypothetical protein
MLLLFQWHATKHDKQKLPQKFAIANGFVIGSFPQEVKWITCNGDTEKRIIQEHELTDLLKAMMAPVRPYGSIFAYTGGAQKSIRGNYQFLKWIRTGLVELYTN